MEIIKKVQEIFRDIFEDENLVIQDSTSADDIEDWDSLANVKLIVAIEQEFGIRIALGEIDEMKSVGELIGLIKKREGPGKED